MGLLTKKNGRLRRAGSGCGYGNVEGGSAERCYQDNVRYPRASVGPRLDENQCGFSARRTPLGVGPARRSFSEGGLEASG